MSFKIKSLIGAGAMALLFAASCDKNGSDVNSGNKKPYSGAAVLADNACLGCDCSNGTDSAEVSNVPIENVGNYTAWTPVASDFCGTGPQVTFEGQFNSIIKGADGWVVGYLDNVSYDTDLNSLNCATVSASIVPTAGNSIGNEHPTSCPTCPGYYDYTTGEFTRLVTVSKCCPDGTVKTYVIKVTTLDAYSVDGYTTFNSKVVYEYKCFTCTGTCPAAPAARSAAPQEHEAWKEIPPMFSRNVK